jgi:hypothetical protein
VEVRKPEQLVGVDSLIIPGGESTTMAKLANYHDGTAPQAAWAPPRWWWRGLTTTGLDLDPTVLDLGSGGLF